MLSNTSKPDKSSTFLQEDQAEQEQQEEKQSKMNDEKKKTDSKLSIKNKSFLRLLPKRLSFSIFCSQRGKTGWKNSFVLFVQNK